MRLLPLLVALLPGTALAQDVCIAPPYDAAASAAERSLSALYGEIGFALAEFPSLGAAMARQSPRLCYSGRMDNAHAYLDAETNRIVLSPDLPRAMQVGVLLHEIRHLDQISLGACPTDDLAMSQYATATFAMEADASAVSLLATWVMKQNGNDAPWRALSAWETQSDIAARFADEMAQTGDPAIAVAAAFRQWFASSARIDAYYSAACSDYLDRQDRTKALPRYHLIGDNFLEDLCRLPDGTRYDCTYP